MKENPSLIPSFAKDGDKVAIAESMHIKGWSVSNPLVNGRQLNQLFWQIVENLNFQKQNGFSYYDESDTHKVSHLKRHLNKIYFCKADNDISNPQTPVSNPDYWTVLLDLDNPILEELSKKVDRFQTVTTDLNNIKTNGFYLVINTASNLPVSSHCSLVVSGNETNTISQMLITRGTLNQVLFRNFDGTSWSSWREPMSKGDFGIGGNSINKGGITPIDDLNINGLYYYSSGTGAPSGNGHVFHQQISNLYAFQMLIDSTGSDAGTCYLRAKDNGTWSAWKKVIDSSNNTGLGINQTWQHVTPSRNAGVTYTNTTGKPIMVYIQGCVESDYKQIFVDNVQVGLILDHAGQTQRGVNTFIVPVGSIYRVDTPVTVIEYWAELR